MGEPHTMNRRLIAQSGTFAVPGVLDMPLDEILSDADQENILAKFVLTHAVREVALRELYRMNITYATLVPRSGRPGEIDGLRTGIPLGLQSPDHGEVSHVGRQTQPPRPGAAPRAAGRALPAGRIARR